MHRKRDYSVLILFLLVAIPISLLLFMAFSR